MRERKTFFLFIAPSLFILLFMGAFPLVFTITLSLHSWEWAKVGTGWEFVGINNYIRIFMKDIRFWQALGRTILISATAVAIEGVIGFALALLLNKEIKGIGLFRFFVILPMMIAPVVAAFLWRIMLHATRGPVNYFLELMGLQPIKWLEAIPWPLISIILCDAWQYIPFMTIIFLAGLQSLPIEPYEAALIDGAGRWEILKYITLPLMRPIILVAIILRTVDVLKLFDVVYVLTLGGPGTATETSSFYAYTVSFRYFSMGYGAALAWILLMITVIISLQLIRILTRR